MLGKITEIKEVFNIEKGYCSMDGYQVTTDKHTVKVLIYNGQC